MAIALGLLRVVGETLHLRIVLSGKVLDHLSGWESNGAGPARRKGLYETTLATSLFEYMIILFFGAWLIVEYFHNVYQREYFGSFNPVFLVAVLMASSAYGFVRLVANVKAETQSRVKKNRGDGP